MLKKNILCLILTFASVCVSELSLAQDIHFSQFWMAPVNQNPALAGAFYDKEGILNYKNQWGSVSSPYKTFNASYDMAIMKQKTKMGFLGAGINIFYDKAGDSQMGTMEASLSAAYHLHLNDRNTVAAGITGGFAQRTINYGGLQWGNQFDGNNYQSAIPSGEPVGAESKTFADMGAGVLWTIIKGDDEANDYERIRMNIAVAAFHLNLPNYSFYNSEEKLYRKWAAQANCLYGFANTDFSVIPGFIYYRQETTQEFVAGSLFRYVIRESAKFTGIIAGSAVSLGIHFRMEDAAIVSAFIEKGLYTFGISYDLNTSDLKPASSSNGGIEISLRYVTPGPFSANSSYKHK